MALIECPECKKEISDKAPACPHCGGPAADRPAEKPNKPGQANALHLILIAVLVAGMAGAILWNAAGEASKKVAMSLQVSPAATIDKETESLLIKRGRNDAAAAICEFEQWQHGSNKGPSLDSLVKEKTEAVDAWIDKYHPDGAQRRLLKRIYTKGANLTLESAIKLQEEKQEPFVCKYLPEELRETVILSHF